MTKSQTGTPKEHHRRLGTIDGGEDGAAAQSLRSCAPRSTRGAILLSRRPNLGPDGRLCFEETEDQELEERLRIVRPRR